MPISEATAFEPGDIVVVPFPYSDRRAEKRRPALVVSNSRLAEQGFLWVAMVTSARQRALPYDAPIADLSLAGLPAPSVVRPTKIATIEPSRVLRRAGRLDRATTTAALATARGFLGE
jgi:mRNA interferase MazF